MNTIKRILGLVWAIAGPLVIVYMLYRAWHEISAATAEKATETLMFWVIVITIFIPVTIGFVLFGIYSLKGEYDHAKN